MPLSKDKMREYQRKRRGRVVPVEPQSFDHLSDEERKVVGEPGDYDWARAVQRMPDSIINLWLSRINTKSRTKE